MFDVLYSFIALLIVYYMIKIVQFQCNQINLWWNCRSRLWVINSL